MIDHGPRKEEINRVRHSTAQCSAVVRKKKKKRKNREMKK